MARKTKTAPKAVKTVKTPRTPKAPSIYAGAPIPATKVYRRDMTGFDAKHKNQCKAEVWMLINETAGTYTFANTYNDQLKASYDPKHYTYALTAKAQKKVDAKAEEMVEVDAPDFPTWIVNAAGTKRKAEKPIRVRLAK